MRSDNARARSQRPVNQHTRERQEWAYKSGDEFISDLEVVRDSLANNRGERLAEIVLSPLLQRARTCVEWRPFGFQLSAFSSE